MSEQTEKDEQDLERAVLDMLRTARAFAPAHARVIGMPGSNYYPITRAAAHFAKEFEGNPSAVLDAMNVGLALGHRWATRDIAEYDGVIVVTMGGEADRQPPGADDLRRSAPTGLADLLAWIVKGR